MLLFVASCGRQLQQEVNDLQKRLEQLENAAGKVNESTQALLAIVRDGAFIKSYTETVDGVSLTLTDGNTYNIFYGSQSTGIVPIISVDAEGYWVMSLDGGQTFSKIMGSNNIYTGRGSAPMIGIDEDGLWIISWDNWLTSSHIMGSDGLPISARDPKQAARGYQYFKHVEFNAESGCLEITLSNGNVVSCLVVGNFYINIEGYTPGQKIHAGIETRWDLQTCSVKSAFWNSTPGYDWIVRITDSFMAITPPDECTPGLYTLELIVISDEGYTKTYTFKLTVA